MIDRTCPKCMSGSECGHAYEHISMDARAQAEQRMAADLREKWTAAHEFLTYSLSDQQKYGLSVLAAKLAAEEIAKAVMERDREWLRSDTDNEGDTIAWHLVCADVESADG